MKTIAQQLKITDFPFTVEDKDGNGVYFENSDGYWWKSEHKDGNEVYYENSSGYWVKWEYKDGNEVYYENSNGYWWKSEYKDGNEVYYENSNGCIIDNRPKFQVKTVTIDGVDYELKAIKK
tara:strand:- start:122 stop:484 length:363 start_codon:yes stop_codon:yes gene_type:complete